jgi:orotate phosphoribosyltransferase
VAELVALELKEVRDTFDVICGVPYTALPVASIVAVQENIPMLLKR